MNILSEKSLKFAIRTFKLAKHLDSKKEFIISNQILKSGTSIGANISEALYAESNLDYIHKYSIAQKECSETLYWLMILNETKIISTEEYTSINDDCIELMKLLVSTLKTLKSKKNNP